MTAVRIMRRMLPVLVVAGALASLAGHRARAVDVSNLSDFESDPCVMGLAERNAAQHVGAPDSALARACERAHGSVEVAWDFLTRTWRPPSIPVGAALGTRLGGADAALALVQMLLTYALLGGPLPGLPALLRPVTAVAASRRRLLAEAASCLLLRLLLGSLLLAVLGLPLAVAFGGALLLLAVIVAMRWAGRSVALASGPQQSEQPASFTAALTAATVNDALARAPGLLALALLARGSWAMLTVGVLLAIAASFPQALETLRRARRSAWLVAALGIVMALSAGLLAGADPVVAGITGSTSAVTKAGVAVLFAALATWFGGGLAARLRPRAHLPNR